VSDLHYREAGTAGDPAVLLVHGYPESSYMWRGVLPGLAAAGFHAIAPDLAGFGDSEPDPPGTWERHVEALERFRTQRGLDELALVVHDWGGLIGLRWACDHPGVAWALAISATGFFADGRWHGLARTMQTEGRGEELVDGMTEEGFAAMLGQISTGIDEADAREYFKAYADEPRRRGQLELYRSGDFSQLAPYEGCLAGLGVPTLLLWGEDDPFAPVAGAERFQREIPGAELEVIEGTGHFVVDEAPERYGELLAGFLTRARRGTAR
jgi:haloalkane dehalogenase